MVGGYTWSGAPKATSRQRHDGSRIYDLRTNQHFTLKQNPLGYEHLVPFIEAFHPDNLHSRKETERFKRFSYEDLLGRDKASLDITWLRDESLEDSDNLPPPEIIAAEIAEDLGAALAQFAEIAATLSARASPPTDAADRS